MRKSLFTPSNLRHNLPGLLILITAIYISGCATIMNGRNQQISVQSEPPGAKCRVFDNINHADHVTPMILNLDRAYNYTMTCSMEGQESQTLVIAGRTSAWVFGNIIFFPFAPIGIAIDFDKGGGFNLNPPFINLVFDTQKKP